MGLHEGTHYVGQMCVEIRGGCAFIAGTNTLCGSIATMIECVRNLKSATGKPFSLFELFPPIWTP